VNKALAVLQMYPNADPLVDFEVLDRGAEKEYIAGSGYEELDDGEMVEGTHYNIVYKGPQIVRWELLNEKGNKIPQPTEAELLAAWEAYQANPPAPPEPPDQKLARLEAQLAVEREDKLMLMEALADVYEMVLTLQSGGGAA
jgi:hypothetical protein